MLAFRNYSDTLVIVLHEIYGINEHIKRVCQNLALQGFTVLCPDLLDGKVFSYHQEEEAYLYFKCSIGFMSARERVIECLKQEGTNYKRVVLVGYSIGATIAWLCSEKLKICDGVIGYYGSRIRDYLEINPKCPVLLLFPEEEKSFHPAELERELTKNRMVEVHILEGTHGFADPFSKKYNEKSSGEANRIEEDFLARIEGHPMKRLLGLQSQLLREIEKYEKLVPERDKLIDWERVHMASSARLGYLLAQARGVDAELASCACAVHDYGRIVAGKQEGHAEAGYLPGKEFLKRTELFTEDEIEQMALAIKNHSKKSEIGTPIEEIVKDADVIDYYQYGFGFSREEQRLRYEKLMSSEKLVLAK